MKVIHYPFIWKYVCFDIVIALATHIHGLKPYDLAFSFSFESTMKHVHYSGGSSAILRSSIKRIWPQISVSVRNVSR